MDDLRQRLRLDIGIANWRELKIKAPAQSLILVSVEQDLLDIAVDIAQDDAKRVEQLLTSGALLRPGEEMLACWDRDNPQFTCLIVRPFLLMQVKAS